MRANASGVLLRIALSHAIVLGVVLTAPSLAQAQCIRRGLETWSNTKSGWTGTSYTLVLPKASGGNSGGYLEGQGQYEVVFGTKQPKFTGDYSASGRVKFTFDLLLKSPVSLAHRPELRVRASFGENGWSYTLRTFQLNSHSWQSFTVPFSPSWTDGQAIQNGWTKAAPSQSFAATMRNVVDLQIRTDGGQLGLDNFQLVDWTGVGPVERWEPPLNGWVPPDVTAAVNGKTPGGFPDGYLESQGSDVGFFTAKPEFTGDYASSGWHILKLDLFGWGSFYAFPEINLRGGDGTRGWSFPLRSFNVLAGWQHFSIFFNPAWTDAQAMGAGWVRREVATAPFATITQNVERIGVQYFTMNDNGLAGVDNFELQSNCPPPIP